MKPISVVKMLVAAVAAALGSLAATSGLPASWHSGVMVGLSVCTVVSQFTKEIGAEPQTPKA